jgi:two-component system sensor histidine kinase ChvG
MARELDSLVASLRSSADELRRAAEDNAHALKTPVATIRHAAESLEGEVTGPEARERLALVLRATDRLAEMVQSIRRLDVAAADAMLPNRARLDLSALLRALTDDYAVTARGNGVALVAEIAPDLKVIGDADLLETVFENVLDNALSFSPAGSRIVLAAARHDDRIEVTIEDQGPGVDPAMIERIFERHVSARPQSDQASGGHFGIGLWICRRHVAAHGGTIAAESRPAGGLCMRVTLPAP